MPSKRASRRFQDILDNIESIQRYTHGMRQEKFVANNLVVDAVERCLSRMSEAAKKLGATAEDLAPGQPWAKIRGLGNLLRHEYDTIRRSVLWEIVTEDLSSLQNACKKALAKLPDKDKRKS